MLVEAGFKDPVGQIEAEEFGSSLKPSQVCVTHYGMDLLLCHDEEMELIRAHISWKLLLVWNSTVHGCVFDVLGSFDRLSFHCKSHQAVELRSSASDEKVPTMSCVPTQKLQ